jgi:iron complex outermembrane receptor protein
VYYNQFKDYIYSESLNQVIDELDGYQYTQADATFTGFEVELVIPLNQWQWRLFSDNVRASLDAGGDLPRITPRRVGSSVDFNSQNWNLNLTVTHAAKQDRAGYGESATDSYTRFDARIDYRLALADVDYTLFLKASNLNDTEIRNASSYLRNIAPEAGRNLQAGVRVAF